MAIGAVTHYAYRALVAAGGVAVVLAIVLAFVREHPLGPTAAHAWVWGAVVPTYVVGVFALAVRPNHLVARWLGAMGSLLALQTAGNNSLGLIHDLPDGVWAASSLGLHLVTMATVASIASLLTVFPDDRYQHRYQRHLVWTVWSLAFVLPLLLALSHRVLLFTPLVWPRPEVENPLYLPALEPLSDVAATAFHWRVAPWLVGAVAMAVRYRLASRTDRLRFKWPLGAALLLTVFVVTFRALEQADLMPQELRSEILLGGWVPGIALFSGSLFVALVRHRVIGVDLWLRRSILFGGASTLIALAYLGLAGLLGLAAGHEISLGVGVFVTLTAVVAFHPARHRLEAWARQWVFGRKVVGTEVLRRVGDTLEDAHDIAQLGSNLVQTVVEGLDLEWARMTLSADAPRGQRPIATLGVGEDEPAVADLVVPMTDHDETVGFLECGPKRHGELSKADEALLTSLARQAALAVRNVRLTAELEQRLAELSEQAEELAASRTRILQAQTEERRRIERNIHDGVQQEIIASIAKLRLARNQLSRGPEQAATTLADLQDDLHNMLENLRELSRGIHPPVLTHRGLADAVRTKAGLLPIDVEVDVAPDVRSARFPEAVEEAAYYVVAEGLTNVVKHAQTKRASVKLRMDNGLLTLEVADRGQGYDTTDLPGSGIVGLRDRLSSFGGELRVDSRRGKGTTLRATLPTKEASPHA